MKKKVWLVKHPLSLYKENVKELAVKNSLVIVDNKYRSTINPKLIELKPPKLTFENEEGKQKDEE